ncbi:transcription factor VIP1-like [Phaseolus vulgaris]
MENNDIGAPSDAALFYQMPPTEQPHSPMHHWRIFSDHSYPLLDTLDNLPNFDSKHLDFEMPNSSLLPPLPPTASLVSVDSETSEKPSWQIGAAPVVPTAGLDRGKSVVSGDLCMAGGGADGCIKDCGKKKKAKPRRKNASLQASLTKLMQAGPPISLARKRMEPEELAELAKVDPMKAKRILANRKSAAKSKEKKERNVIELQKKEEWLEIEVVNHINNIVLCKRQITVVIVHAKEIRIKLEAMQEEDRSKPELNLSSSMLMPAAAPSYRYDTLYHAESLKDLPRPPQAHSAVSKGIHGLEDENKNLDVLSSYRSPGDLFAPFSSNLLLHQFHNPPSQQHLNPLQPQLSMPNPLAPSGPSFTGHYGPNFSNFCNFNKQN